MPEHLRKQLKDRAVHTLLGLTTTGANVFPSRTYPLERAETPGLAVYTSNEESILDDHASSSDGFSETRHLTLNIDAYVTETTDDTLDNTIDAIAYEVEVAMANDRTLNSLAMDSYFTRSETEIYSEGDQPIAVMEMEFIVVYSILTSAPDVAR